MEHKTFIVLMVLMMSCSGGSMLAGDGADRDIIFEDMAVESDTGVDMPMEEAADMESDTFDHQATLA